MADPETRTLIHLARGMEELLRAASGAATDARRFLEEDALRERPAPGIARGLARLLDRVEGPGLEALRTALRAETARWAELEPRDPAAARVRGLFAALLEVLEPDPDESPDASSAPRTRAAPLRSTRQRAR